MRARALFIAGLLLAGAAHAEEPAAEVEPPAATAAEWGALKAPGAGTPQAIGRYGGGCLDGGRQLPERGKGYTITRPERARFFGHPVLIGLIESLGKRARALGLPPLPIGDVAQARGGPAPSGHASHQTGLDVDIWYLMPKDGDAPSLVDRAHNRLTAHFGKAIARLLQLVASDPAVDRLFVNPVIKRALCAAADKDRSWLRKVRPWWGHHDHFHVRLPCPPDSPLCENQPPLPPGDGCDELAWWFRKHVDQDPARKAYQARVGATPPLPEPCRKLVAEAQR
jgi:penicillin-insensitive murein DD-endopeptidase